VTTTYSFALLQLYPKYQKHFATIIVFVPACEPIPSDPHGFDNLFFIEMYYNFTPYTCGLSASSKNNMSTNNYSTRIKIKVVVTYGEDWNLRPTAKII
jgi:hypothetical protein